ncbi:hypothetical protein HK104_010499, partial [Borealophlyctis nickersoniae]
MVFIDGSASKHMWIQVFILLILWAIAHLISTFFRGHRKTGTIGQTVPNDGYGKHPYYGWRTGDAAKKAMT